MFRSTRHTTAFVAIISLVFSLTGPVTVLAATTPSLGSATTYAILGSTYTNTTAGTIITGNIGFTTAPAVVPAGVHPYYGSGAPYPAAITDQGNALAGLNAQACTYTFAPGAIDLSTDATHGTIGVYAPGVYCSAGAMDVGGLLTLSGSGTFIFRPDGAFTSTANAIVTLDGASACNVFWTSSEAATLAANTTFVGTIITDAGITVGANTTWSGRALAAGGTVTTDSNTITVPICSAAFGTLHIAKQVVNTGGGTATADLFDLHVTLGGTDVTGSPAAGTDSPGMLYSLAAGTYVVSETANASYITSFDGACDLNGTIILTSGADVTCTVTNTYSPASVTPAALHLIKQVVNTGGGTATADLFNLHVTLGGTDVVGSPAAGTASPGTEYSLLAGTYVISEEANSSYVRSFNGACDLNGLVVLAAGQDVTCTVTNTYSPVPVVPAVLGATITPTLPNTGIAPEGNLNPPDRILLASLLLVVSASLAAVLTRRTF
ncbi:hypothetical protein AUK40_05065 [Candidatus Wirthbacteria bacterium CG2_30_54_11]|uniref:SpaA-like prealbumin fold domain-containing protein n=1 Tax=Candidatus Wirthbacteria bacterium CG2_30_54_11 TaxID=1817892 RepID=A0A1J5IYQ6_9BACT|nr:MAG: hypothetical protein AUK40_05065 [Candidatus Wirthbacteria bacterium CG2_30_54_11]